MSTIRNSIRTHPAVIAFVLFSIAIIVAFGIQERATHDRKKQICTAQIEDRIVIRDIVNFALPAVNQSPALKQFRDNVYSRTAIPPKICSGTGVDVRKIIADGKK